MYARLFLVTWGGAGSSLVPTPESAGSKQVPNLVPRWPAWPKVCLVTRVEIHGTHIMFM